MSTDIKMLLWDKKIKVWQKILVRKQSNGNTELHQLYHFLDCDTIDITTRIINKQYFDIIVDDNGLLIDNYIFSYFENKEPQLAGNLLFTKSNEEGENIGLTNKQMTHIIDNLQIIGYTMGGNSFEGLHQFTD